DLVHDIRFVGFNFAAHVKEMDAAALKLFVKKFDTWSLQQHEQLFGKKVLVLDFFRDNPKLAIWYSAMATVAIVYGIKEIQISARRASEEHLKWKGLIEFAGKLAEVSTAKGLPL